jgi:hypothetical protein
MDFSGRQSHRQIGISKKQFRRSSTLSASAAETLRRFTGSDAFGGTYRRAAGVSAQEGKPGPTGDVLLSWATFTEAADESGMSRRYAGLHFEDADLEGRRLGRRVAALSWKKAQDYMLGTGGSNRGLSAERKVNKMLDPILSAEQERGTDGNSGCCSQSVGWSNLTSLLRQASLRPASTYLTG